MNLEQAQAHYTQLRNCLNSIRRTESRLHAANMTLLAKLYAEKALLLDKALEDPLEQEGFIEEEAPTQEQVTLLRREIQALQAKIAEEDPQLP